MGTTIRPETSKKNPYWINKHRYYELKHFCLQYPIWKQAYDSLDGLSKRPEDLALYFKTNEHGDPTARCVMAKEKYLNNMAMLWKAADKTDKHLGNYIFIGVTEGCSYEILKARYNIPCCKDVYYDLYHKFFWYLSKERD